MKTLKKLYLPTLMLAGTFSLAQNKNLNTVETVHKMAIYPGCEEIKSNDKMTECFAKKLSLDISNIIDSESIISNFDKKATNIKLVSKAMITVNKDGKISKVEVIGDKILNKAVEISFEKLIAEYESNNIKIKPAKDAKGNNVDLAFNLPVRFAIM